MSKSLVNALGDGAWSVSAVVFDLNDMLDDEGRPISERRADAVVRAGVEMEMKECPYSGIRHGKLMNVSALVQISHYFNDATAEMSAFRREAGDDANWDDMLACIVDLLSQPAIYLLQQHSPSGPVPAQMAVSHKLAAGFFGVLRGLHERLALGHDLPVTVNCLLAVVDEMGALVGASEACAGSPQMIRKACTALVEGTPESSLRIDPVRLDIARCLTLQVQLGIFWHLYDRFHLWTLVRGEFGGHLQAGNKYLADRLAGTRSELPDSAPPRPDCSRLPAALEPQFRRSLAEALCENADQQALAADIRAASELLSQPNKAMLYDGEIPPLAMRIAWYLNTHRQIMGELSRLELVLREHLKSPADQPLRLGAAAFPIPQALSWYQLLLGRRLGPNCDLAGKQTAATQ